MASQSMFGTAYSNSDSREDYTNALYGLLFAGIPAVNSLEAVHACLEVILI